MGGTYQDLQPDDRSWLWSQQLQLYLGVHQSQLRFVSPDGQLILTPEEATAQERQRAEQAEQRADRLAEKLRELGIDPSQL